jgi:NADPH:quinone reductase-like Zn-dependent oxidoreductase
MKAVVYKSKGSPDKLVYCDVKEPVPKEDEVLIKVFVASGNAADYRSMKMRLIPKKKIFGSDIAGRVEAVGSKITRLKVGDEVAGDLADYGFGGFAEYAVAPETVLVKKPVGVSFLDAAAFPLASLTALQALRDKGKIEKDHKVLIVGSGGGVGSFAVQLASYFGAEVSAVCGPGNVEKARELGAKHVFDYTKDNFLNSNEHYNLILAINGSYSLRAYKRLLGPGGIYVMIGGSMSQILKSLVFGRLIFTGSLKMHTVSAKPNHTDLDLVIKLIESGEIKPLIDRTYPLDQTAEAMKYLSEGHARGKVLIRVEG